MEINKITTLTQLNKYLSCNWGKIKNLQKDELVKRLEEDGVEMDLNVVLRRGKELDIKRATFKEARPKPIESKCPLCGIEHKSKKGKRAYCPRCAHKIKKANGYI